MKEHSGAKKLIAAFMAILKEELGYEIKGKVSSEKVKETIGENGK